MMFRLKKKYQNSVYAPLIIPQLQIKRVSVEILSMPIHQHLRHYTLQDEQMMLRLNFSTNKVSKHLPLRSTDSCV
jgi:hypothetical protein